MKRIISLSSFLFFILIGCSDEGNSPNIPEDSPPVKYTVIYNGNGNTGGDIPIDNNEYSSGDVVTIKGNYNSLVKTGFSFTGWNTQIDGLGTDYTVNSVINITRNLELYAKWTSNPVYTVTYHGNGNTGGLVPVDNTSYESGSSVIVLGKNTLSRSGYTFVGWTIGSTTYTEGQSFNISSNTILYAKWSSNPTYSVTYNGNGSTEGSVPVDSTGYESGSNVTVKSNTGNLKKFENGFYWSFEGWNTQANGSGTAYISSESFVIESSNVTLYAQWSAIGRVVFEGGTIFYDKGFYSDEWRFMSYKVPLHTARWGRLSWNISLGTSPNIGAGKQNTLNINTEDITVGIAAKYALAYVSGPYVDWYLPSENELHAIYTNLIQTEKVEYLISLLTDTAGFWSSTQENNNQAKIVKFYGFYGPSVSDVKAKDDNTINIIVIRYF